MNTKATIEAFADEFVLRAFRDRFKHEAFNKPGKLHERICHRIPEIFASAFERGAVNFSPGDKCLVLEGATGFREMTWWEAAQKMNMYGGPLVIDASGL